MHLYVPSPKKPCPSHHLVPPGPFGYYIGWRVSSFVTLHTRGVESKQPGSRTYMYLNCPVWHTTGLFFISIEAVKALCDDAMTDSQPIKKGHHHHNHKFCFIYYINIPLFVPKKERNPPECRLNSRSSLKGNSS